MAGGDLKRKSVYNLYMQGINISVQWAYNLKSESIRIHTGMANPSNVNGGSQTNKESPQWLGITVGEKVLSKVFKNVEIMNTGNKGYDFICNGGYKIDVKTATRRSNRVKPAWMFASRKIKCRTIFCALLLIIGKN